MIYILALVSCLVSIFALRHTVSFMVKTFIGRNIWALEISEAPIPFNIALQNEYRYVISGILMISLGTGALFLNKNLSMVIGFGLLPGGFVNLIIGILAVSNIRNNRTPNLFPDEMFHCPLFASFLSRLSSYDEHNSSIRVTLPKGTEFVGILNISCNSLTYFSLYNSVNQYLVIFYCYKMSVICVKISSPRTAELFYASSLKYFDAKNTLIGHFKIEP